MKRQMQKILAVALCALLLVSAICSNTVTARAAEDWSYEISDDTVTLTRYLGSDEDVVVPAEVDGKPVVALGDGALAGIPEITSITVPSGVTAIGEEAFADCPDLVSVTLPNSVESIGRRAFRYCGNLETVVLPETLSALPYQAFWDCQSLESIIIPSGVSVIPNGCFYNCFALREVTVPASVTTLEKNAFHACIHMDAITLSADVTTIDDSAFSDCEYLVIHAPEGSVADVFAKENGYVPEPVVYESAHPYDGDCSFTHNEPGAAAIKVTFSPHTYVKGVWDMDQIVLTDAGGNEFVYIGDALAGQTLVLGGDTFTLSMETLFASSNLTDFGFRITAIEPMSEEDYAAYLADLDANPWESHVVNGTLEITGYRGLQSEVTVPAKINNISVTSIGANAFLNSRIVTHVTIENGIQRIGANAFDSCYALAQVELPQTLTEIGDFAFSSCYELEALNIPDGVTALPTMMACNCVALSEITLPQSLEVIGDAALYGCESLTEIAIPSTVTEIGEEAFSGTGLTALSLPYGITAVPNKLCRECEDLEDVTLPETVTSIGNYAFFACSGLTELKLPEGLKSIGNSALASTGIDTITFPNGLETLGNAALNGTALTSVHIPATLQEIGTNPFTFCPLTEITVDEANPYFSAVDNCLCSKDGATLLVYPGGVTGTFVVPSSVTRLGRESCVGASMTKMIIPANVTEAEIGAIMQCKNLEYVDIRAQLTTIPESFLASNPALTVVRLPDTITTIEWTAFSYCTALKTAYFDSTEAQWQAIEWGKANDPLKNATVHYAPYFAVISDGEQGKTAIAASTEDAMIVAALYDAQGKMIDVKIVRTNDAWALPENATLGKAFVVDAAFAPLREAVDTVVEH